MDTTSGVSLLRHGDPRWERINRGQTAEDDARWRALSVAERLDRGLHLSRTAADWRRAAWEALHGGPAA